MKSLAKTGLLIVCFLSLTVSIKALNADSVLRICKTQMETLITNTPYTFYYPRTLNTSGNITFVYSNDWTSGFFPGSLWYLGGYFNDDNLKTKAVNFNDNIKSQQTNTSTCDLGFMLYNSFGNGYKITPRSDYRTILINSANSFKTRFNQKVGCTRSWDFGSWDFPVIIDNMMSLELFFWATKQTGDSTYYKIADSHATRTMQEFFRPDFSSYHLVNFNGGTGDVISKETFQGVSANTPWARGQSWGLYGFTMCYRETGKVVYLNLAREIARWLKEHTPSDQVPYWDFMAPNIPNEPKDASAAAIRASALLELATLDPENARDYIDQATSILESLSSPVYMASNGQNKGFILKHSTGNKPANKEVDVPENFADYYFIEALVRYRQLELSSSVSNPKVNLFKIFPNPVKNVMNIQCSDFQKNVKNIWIMDVNGKLLKKQNFKNNISCEFLQPGNYFIKVEFMDGKFETQSFLKN